MVAGLEDRHILARTAVEPHGVLPEEPPLGHPLRERQSSGGPSVLTWQIAAFQIRSRERDATCTKVKELQNWNLFRTIHCSV